MPLNITGRPTRRRTAPAPPPAQNAAPTNGLIRRWRADSVNQADGSGVASWTDSIASTALTQATSGNQPTLLASAVNGRPALRWPQSGSGNTTYLEATGLAALALPATFAFVLNIADNGGMEAIHAGAELYVGGGKWTMYDGGGSGLSPAGNATAAWQVVVAQFNGTSSKITVNGTTASGSIGSNSLATTYRLGQHTNGSNSLRGAVAEVLQYNTVLSDADLIRLDSYAQDRYGISVADYVAA